MHRIDGDAQYPAGHFSEGDPGVPRLPTQVTASWLDDVQEELVSIVLGAGLTLIKGTAQLGAVVANLNVAQTFTALKTFSAGLSAGASTFTGLLTASGGLSAVFGDLLSNAAGTPTLKVRNSASDSVALEVHSAATVDNDSASAPTLTLSNAASSGVALSVPDGVVNVTESLASREIYLTGSATRAALNAPVVSALPTSPMTGDRVVMFDSGTTYLYHCDSAPSSWSRVAFTRLY